MSVNVVGHAHAPLVSIIVPAYRHERFVIDCLRSIHAQTYNELELIFIDDCSPDRTYDYVSALMRTSFKERFRRVCLLRHDDNKGAHASINLGLEVASGEYIAIINSDDLFHASRIEIMLDSMRSKGSDLAFSAVDAFEASEDKTSSNNKDHKRLEVPPSLLLLNMCQQLDIARERSIGYALLRKNVAISTGNFVFSKSLASKIGGFQPLKYCHDWDFILQSLAFNEPVYIPQSLYQYRLHQANTFRSVQDLASIETEVVLSRFLRMVGGSEPINKLCPSPARYPGYFEAFIFSAGYEGIWRKVNNIPARGQRVYENPLSVFEYRNLFGVIQQLMTAS